ncbi:hypothetical protein DCO47_24550 [Pseudomonas sp. NDM]|nr:hypothetical protein DCO47_24550 [Pseudomonas sp. NDM]
MAATIAVFRIGSNSKRRRNQKPLTLTLSRRERGLTEGFGRVTPTWHIEPNAGPAKIKNPLTLALSQRERGLTEESGRGTPTWYIELDSGLQRSKAPHPSPLPEGQGTDRGGWASYADMKYRIESKKAKNRPSTTQHNERKLEYRS